jgi:hypothetical protein
MSVIRLSVISLLNISLPDSNTTKVFKSKHLYLEYLESVGPEGKEIKWKLQGFCKNFMVIYFIEGTSSVK